MSMGLSIAIIIGVFVLIFILLAIQKKMPEKKAVEEEQKRTNEVADKDIQLAVLNGYMKSIARSLDIIAGIMLGGVVFSALYFFFMLVLR